MTVAAASVAMRDMFLLALSVALHPVALPGPAWGQG